MIVIADSRGDDKFDEACVHKDLAIWIDFDQSQKN
jgi:hypothetical protein